MSNFKYSILLFVLFVSPLYLKAQDKIGYLNVQELLESLPQYNNAVDSLTAYQYSLWHSKRIHPYSSKQIEELLEEKQAGLLMPLEILIMNAIKAVAKEHGYTYVIDSGVLDVLIIAPEADNIFPLVMQKLGGSWVSEKGLD